MKKTHSCNQWCGIYRLTLMRRLLKKGNEVIWVDNYFSGSKQNIIHLLDHSYFEIIRHDTTFPL